jgi:tetratricopeptide (TPR) repeat protein
MSHRHGRATTPEGDLLESAIHRHLELETPTLPLLTEACKAAGRHAWGVAIDALLEAVAVAPDHAEVAARAIEIALLRGDRRGARLLLRLLQRRSQLDPAWISPTEAILLDWLVSHEGRHSLEELARQLLAGPAALRKAYLPIVLRFLSQQGKRETAATLLAAWMETYRSDEEAWWLLLEEALENRATDPITQLGPIETWPQPYTCWQWILLARMATIAPEPTCWILLQKIVRALSSFPHPSARQVFVERIVAHLEHDDPRAQLIAALLSRYVGVHAIDPPLHVLFPSGSRIARALAAGLLIPGRPDRTDPAAFSEGLSDLMSLLTESDEQASLVRTLLPELNPMAIAEYALCSEIPSWHRQALRLLESCGATAAELSALATRLDLAGFHVSAGSVLRLAAKFAHQQGDRTTLLSVLHQLIRVDPGEDAAIDFVINTETRAGRTSRAIDTLIAAATRAHDRGAIARSVALLERAQTLAEMSDDRPRLALAAELLATTDEGSAERHVAAATALLRAGHLDRARAQLWTALRRFLQERRLDDALATAEQLVALDPADDAARAQLHELQILRRQAHGRAATHRQA